MQYIEALLRYLLNSLEDTSLGEIREIISQAWSAEKGKMVMTLAEKLRNEGRLKGRKEGRKEGREKGLLEGIELALIVKFADKEDYRPALERISRMSNVARLKAVEEAIKSAATIAELLEAIENGR